MFKAYVTATGAFVYADKLKLGQQENLRECCLEDMSHAVQLIGWFLKGWLHKVSSLYLFTLKSKQIRGLVS